MNYLQEVDTAVHERLTELLAAETDLAHTLPKLAARVATPALRDALLARLRETADHSERLTQVARALGHEPAEATCLGIQGLLRECESTLARASGRDQKSIDRSILTAARKIEHYEIVAYEDLIDSLTRAGRSDLADILAPTLVEEIDSDKRLLRIADKA